MKVRVLRSALEDPAAGRRFYDRRAIRQSKAVLGGVAGIGGGCRRDATEPGAPVNWLGRSRLGCGTDQA